MKRLFFLFLTLLLIGCESIPPGESEKDLPPLSDVVDLACGQHHCCALRKDGNTYCWGNEGANGFELPLYYGSKITTTLPGIKLKSTGSDSCLLKSDQQTITCWYGDFDHNSPPYSQHLNHRVIDFTLKTDSFQNLYYIASNGKLYGIQTHYDWTEYEERDLNAHLIVAGLNHFCYLLKTGETFCWGDNQKNQIKNDDINEIIEPLQIIPSLEVRKISTGDNYTCVLTIDNTLYCWGAIFSDNNQFHELKQSNILDVDVGPHHACLVDMNHQVFCWGDNIDHHFIHSDQKAYNLPTPICRNDSCSQKLKSVRALSLGNRHTCAIMLEEIIDGKEYSNTVHCWGYNRLGELGNNDSEVTYRALPEYVRFEK